MVWICLLIIVIIVSISGAGRAAMYSLVSFLQYLVLTFSRSLCYQESAPKFETGSFLTETLQCEGILTYVRRAIITDR